MPGARYDAHTHTNFSDGRNTVAENVRAAEACGLDCVAITDHFPEEGDWFPRMVAAVRLADEKSSISVLTGIEATILNVDGDISLPEDCAAELDLVLVDIGGRTQGLAVGAPSTRARTVDNLVSCLENVCHNPLVHVIAHPFSVGRLPQSLYLTDLPRSSLLRVADAMRETGTAFEIMNQMYWWFPEVPVTKVTRDYAGLVALIAAEGVKFVLGSDAHSCCGVGNLDWAVQVLRMAEVPGGQVVNLAKMGEQTEAT
ncbi:MAG: PHP domain-containing protein [Armatimonadota bacterium]